MYIPVGVFQLPSVRDGTRVLVNGSFSWTREGKFLVIGHARLPLVGLPFTYVPENKSRIEVWGQIIRGKTPYLIVHDARPVGSSADEPRCSQRGELGDEISLFLRVHSLGDDTVGIAIDRTTYVLTGMELHSSTYAVVGKIIRFSPPTLEVVQAIPVTLSAPEAECVQTYATPPGQA